jgi:hypothetical protein
MTSADSISLDVYMYRPELMFYELDFTDPFGASPWKRSEDPHLNGTFGGDLNMFRMVTEAWDPNIKLRQEELIKDDDAARVEAFNAQFSNATGDLKALLDLGFEWPNLLPDG